MRSVQSSSSIAIICGCLAVCAISGCGRGQEVCVVDGQMPAAGQMCCSGSSGASGACCSGIGCTTSPPPPSNMCTADGVKPTAQAPCCSGSQNSHGYCCSGSACTPLPDSVVSGVSLSRYTTSSTVYLCVNQAPDGTLVNAGNYVETRNIGTAIAVSYDITLGMFDVDDPSQLFPCTRQMAVALTSAGNTYRRTSAFCCSIDRAQLTSGNTYGFFAYADWNERIDELREDNNAAIIR